MREIARCRTDKEKYSKKFWEIELLTIFTTIVCLIAWGVLIIFSSKYQIYFIALVPTLLATMFDISWFYTGHEKIGYRVLLVVVEIVTGALVYFICLFILKDVMIKEAFLMIKRKVKKNGGFEN